MENDLKGNENCFELAKGSSYRGLKLRRVELKSMHRLYNENPGEIQI